jgi:TolB-like protein
LHHRKLKPRQKTRRKAKIMVANSGVAFAALLILIGTALAVWPWQQTRHREEIRAIAVLPLENLSGDPSQEFFADGITDELITEIAHLRPLRVISRTSVLRYKGISKSLLEIARELGLDAILEGTVLRSGQQARVTAQLIDARTDAHRWSEEYTREVRDVLSLQREIAGDVAHQTRLHLLPEQHSRIATPLPIDPEAHDEYLRGRYIFGMMVAHLSKKFTDKRQYTDLDILAAIGHF